MIHIFRFIVNTIVLYLIAKYLPGFNHTLGYGTAVIVAVIFGLVNALIGPILRIIALPVTWMTHGLFGIVINYILFVITAHVSPNFQLATGSQAWIDDAYGAVVMMLVGTIIQQMWKHPSEGKARA
jgi:putative membrane protein